VLHIEQMDSHEKGLDDHFKKQQKKQ